MVIWMSVNRRSRMEDRKGKRRMGETENEEGCWNWRKIAMSNIYVILGWSRTKREESEKGNERAGVCV